MKQIINAHQARNIAKESEGYFETMMEKCEQVISDAAKQGKFETNMPFISDGKIKQRVVEHLTLNCGFEIKDDPYRIVEAIIKW